MLKNLFVNLGLRILSLLNGKTFKECTKGVLKVYCNVDSFAI